MKLIIGLAGNLPQGVSGDFFDTDYQSLYRPFLQTLYSHPEICSVMYFSGVWFEWFEKYHPEFITLMSEMGKKKKQIEFLSGGYYEPILSLIPHQDRVGQLESLNTFIRQNCGQRPLGCYLTCNCWDNSLIASIKSSLDYAFLDKSELFICDSDKKGKYNVSVTEEQGVMLSIFPVASDLTAKIVSQTPVEFFYTLSEIKEKDAVISLFFTPDILRKIDYTWIDDFFKIIASDKNVEVITPSKYAKSNYLPDREFYNNKVFFKKFLSDSEEFSNLYAKMIFVKILVYQIRGDKYKKKTALDELWKGQGFFSKFDHLSCKKAYSCFIKAEKMTREKSIFIPSLIKTDFKLLGGNEYLYQGDDYNAYISSIGASVFEFDNIALSKNYISLDAGIKIKGMFSDFFINNAVYDNRSKTPENASAKSLSDVCFETTEYDREKKTVKFSCREKTKEFSVKVLKNYQFLSKKIEVLYEVINTGSTLISNKFAVSFNISFCNVPECRTIQEKRIDIMDKNRLISIVASNKCDFIFENIIDDKGGYLSTQITGVWDMGRPEPGKTWTNSVGFIY